MKNHLEVLTALRALQEAAWRMDVIVEKLTAMDDNDDPDPVFVRILQESGKEAGIVAANAFETLDDFGFDIRATEAETFDAAFDKLRAEPLESKQQAA